MSTTQSHRQSALSAEAKHLIGRLTGVVDLLPKAAHSTALEAWQGLRPWCSPPLTRALNDNPTDTAALHAALKELAAATDALLYTDVPRLERAVRYCLRFPGYHVLPEKAWQRYHSTVLDPLWAEYPAFAMLSALHGDGYVREAALRSLTAPLTTPLLAHILMRRLLDWVPQVREQTMACLERLEPQSDPACIADGLLGALIDLPRRPAWRDAGVELFRQLAGTGVIRLAAQRLGQRRNGPGGMLLRRLMIAPEIDELLPSLMTEAAQPAVRAVALRCLLSAHAHYPRGLRRKWIDKSMGCFTLVLDLEERPLTITPPSRPSLILQGLNDGAACVRRIALEAAAQESETVVPTDKLRRIAEADPAGSVRDRASYLIRRQAGDRGP